MLTKQEADEALRQAGLDPAKVGAMAKITAHAAMLAQLMDGCPYRDNGYCTNEKNMAQACNIWICPFCDSLRSEQRVRLTNQELDEIRARCEAASPAPWVANAVTRGNTIAVIPAEHEKDQYYIDPWPPSDLMIRNDRENAAFIACARQDVPRLLDFIERLREALWAEWNHTT